MALALVRCSIKDDQGGIPHARARVSLISWKGRSHALLFMVPLGPPSVRPMAQALRLPLSITIFLLGGRKVVQALPLFHRVEAMVPPLSPFPQNSLSSALGSSILLPFTNTP